MRTPTILQTMVKDERGAGFLESLIAIILGGITCVALIGVAVAVIREAKNNEIRDALTYYATEGMERLRIIAKNDFSQIYYYDSGEGVHRGICDENATPLRTTYGYFDSGDEFTILPTTDGTPPIVRITDENEMCSKDGSLCERLSLPSGGNPILYRELSFYPIGTINQECNLVRVKVKVGMIANESGGSYARNFVSETTLEGYISK